MLWIERGQVAFNRYGFMVDVELYKQVLTSQAVTVLLTDEDGRITFCCPNVERMFGYPPDEVMAGGNVATLLGGLLVSRQELDASGEVANKAIEARTRDGQLRRVIANIKRVPLENATRLYVLQDITELEERLCVSEEQSRQQHEACKQESVATIARGIAHDFNNLLAALCGCAELARQDLRTIPPSLPSLDENLDQILKTIRRATDLVHGIHAFSQRVDVPESSLNPASVVHEAIGMLRRSALPSIRIEQEIDTVCGAVRATSTQLTQIVTNLCTNGCRAMEPGGGVLHVRLASCVVSQELPVLELEPGPYVVLSVRDSGAGISEELLARVFEPYAATRTARYGTGMGLAIVHNLVNGLGGKVVVRSELAEGAEFLVYLPTCAEQVVSKEPSHRPAPTATGHILFVDDEPMLAKLSATILRQLGYEVTACRNGREALKAIKAAAMDFDLLIVDETMPGMNGSELAKHVLAIRPRLPIILCTGYSTLISESEAKAIGIREIIYKPVTKERFAQVIHGALHDTA